MNKLSNKYVLIVDDEERNLFALRSYLEAMDMNILTAGNGREAISILRETKRVDIVLLDMMMPVMDGYETLGLLGSDPTLRKIPVLAVTARAMRGDREKCLEAGAWDYVSKPIDMTLLIEKLNYWINEHEF